MIWLKAHKFYLAFGLCAALVAAVFLIDRYAKRANETAIEAGRQQERSETHKEAIKQMEKADAAAQNIQRNSDARRAECLQDSRTPENC